MTGPTRLVLVRHAQPHGGNLVLPTLDVELDRTGREQAEALAGSLAALGPAAVYSSPLARAVQTARPPATQLGLEPEIVPDLREIDFGEIAGLSLEALERLHPELIGWTSAPSRLVFPGGESVRSLRDRTVPAVEAIVRANPGATAVVVCHGVVIRAVLADVLEMPLDAMFRFDVPYGGTSVIDWFGDHALVRSINGPL